VECVIMVACRGGMRGEKGKSGSIYTISSTAIFFLEHNSRINQRMALNGM
jgi:hypothetical protein